METTILVAAKELIEVQEEIKTLTERANVLKKIISAAGVTNETVNGVTVKVSEVATVNNSLAVKNLSEADFARVSKTVVDTVLAKKLLSAEVLESIQTTTLRVEVK